MKKYLKGVLKENEALGKLSMQEREMLIFSGYNPCEFKSVDRRAEYIRFVHRETGKIVDIRR